MKRLLRSPLFRKYIIYVLSVVALVFALAHCHIILSGCFVVRRYLWFALTAVLFLFLLSRESFIAIINNPQGTKPTFSARHLALAPLFFFLFVWLQGKIMPQIENEDALHFYTANKDLFAKMTVINKEIILSNSSDTCTFTYTGRRQWQCCNNNSDILITPDEENFFSDLMSHCYINRIQITPTQTFLTFMNSNDLTLRLTDGTDPRIISE